MLKEKKIFFFKMFSQAYEASIVLEKDYILSHTDKIWLNSNTSSVQQQSWLK